MTPRIVDEYVEMSESGLHKFTETGGRLLPEETVPLWKYFSAGPSFFHGIAPASFSSQIVG